MCYKERIGNHCEPFKPNFSVYPTYCALFPLNLNHFVLFLGHCLVVVTSVQPFSISCFNSTNVAWQETNCHVNHEARKAAPHEQQNKVNSRQERTESAGEFGVALANLWTFILDESTTNTRSKQAE